MKIVKFETKNHPILGDCILDFSRGDIYSDIVLIGGSNGSGKTTILNEIFAFMCSIYPQDKKYDVSITFYLESFELFEVNKHLSLDSHLDNLLKIESLRRSGEGVSWNQIRAYNSKKQINDSFTREDTFKGFLKVVYSTVEINFESANIISTTAKNIDQDKSPKEKSNSGISKEITQLLVDIKSLDNQDAADWIDSNVGSNTKVVLQEKRISRFKKAFDYMIESKTFEGVKNENEKKKVYFKNSLNDEIDISNLSSGEKQIVFRAGYLLKNIGTLSGGIVLIDEPEISLHPSWQEKYIKFVRQIFSDKDDVIQTQIIIATHSPFIIQNNNISEEKIIILEKHDRDTIESELPKFYGYSQPEAVFVPVKLTTKPLLLVEGEGDKHIITHAWNRLYPKTPLFFDIKWAGEPNVGGATLLQRHLLALQQHATNKVIGLFDADEKGLNEYKGTKTKQPSDFIVNSNSPSLKILNKVGATFLPCPDLRLDYFNFDYPKFSLLTIEFFFSDEVLASLGVVESNKIKICGKEFISLKTNHTISTSDLLKLSDSDFSNFKILFDHLTMCFKEIS